RGHECLYRIRVGHYRLIYEIDDKTNIILVTRIRHWRDVYRYLPVFLKDTEIPLQSANLFHPHPLPWRSLHSQGCRRKGQNPSLG
ncbi:MAG: type II toxin-antitoxin system RelE/ParE family toxin, partial [Deltaproteobacteria bacterium]|nr:type II toxin-antitoxin system RelE/ParE family toxin [Deltaproteobacteria bacterium]